MYGLAGRIHVKATEPGYGEEVKLVTYFTIPPEHADQRTTPEVIPEEYVVGHIVCKRTKARPGGRPFTSYLVDPAGAVKSVLGRQASFAEARQRAAYAAQESVAGGGPRCRGHGDGRD